MSTTRVRLASIDDAERLTNLINSAFCKAEMFFVDGDRITLDGVLDSLKSGEFLVAEQNALILGCVYLEPRGKRTYLGLLSVDPTIQRSGIGSLLMAAAEDRCRARSSQYIDIYIVNLRTELPAFYRRLGYVETGTSPFPEDVTTKIPCYFIGMSKQLNSEMVSK